MRSSVEYGGLKSDGDYYYLRLHPPPLSCGARWAEGKAMIAVTTNSLNHNSTLPPIPNSVECPFLERLTGADILISIAPYPIRTESLLVKHIESGAILVQHKSGLDMIASLGERLDSEIARMCGIAFRQYQRVLLTSGQYGDLLGELTLNGIRTGIKWIQYQGAVSKWRTRGGCVENLPGNEFIPEWCALQLKHLQEMRDKPTKPVYTRARMPDDAPAFDDPLQLCIPVKDGRNTLISIPGVGPELAEWLWRTTGGNLGHCLHLLTSASACLMHEDKPRNLGPSLIKKCREYFGLWQEDAIITQAPDLPIPF